MHGLLGTKSDIRYSQQKTCFAIVVPDHKPQLRQVDTKRVADRRAPGFPTIGKGQVIQALGIARVESKVICERPFRISGADVRDRAVRFYDIVGIVAHRDVPTAVERL